MINKRIELNSCNFIKTILMLFVVLGHATRLWATSGWFNQAPAQDSVVLQYITEWIGYFHIYAFVLVSGYIFAYQKFEQGKYGNFGAFVKRKSMRLLVPYIFVSVIWAAPWHKFYYGSSATEMIKSFILGEAPAQLWFLLMLFWIFVIAFFFPKSIVERPILGGGILAVIYCIGIAGNMVLPNLWRVFTALQYLPFFWIGMLLRYYGTEKLRRIPPVVWVAFYTVLYITKCSLGSTDSIIEKCFNVVLNRSLMFIGAVTAFLVLSNLAPIFRRVSVKNKNIGYSFLENNNFTIYLFHQQVIYGVITLLNGKVSPVILAAANFVIAIGISGIIAVILSKWKITRILIGKKG